MQTKAITQQTNNTIIVADDDPAILDAISMMLEISGYKVEAVSDGNVIERMGKVKPQLVLLDVLMSGVDGRDICRELKSSSMKDIPVILFSASHDMVKSVYSVGANDFIAKPFNIDELLTKVEKHMTAYYA